MRDKYGGVETGGTWCVCALGTGPVAIEHLEEFPTTSPPQTLQRIAAFFEAHPKPAAVGIGSFGPVDADPGSPTWGHVTTTPKPGWQHTAVAPVLRDRLSVPVRFDTDVNAAALGEHRWGAGRDAGSVCYLTVGTGIGAGILIDGRPVRGLIHPEVGHMHVPRDERRDPFPGTCPAHGDCWEGLACGRAIAERWQIDPAALPDDHEAWRLEAEYLAAGIANIVYVVSPHRVIAGGGVMQRAGLMDMVRGGVREIVAGYLETPLLAGEVDRYIVGPELGDRAGVLGAIALAQMES